MQVMILAIIYSSNYLHFILNIFKATMSMVQNPIDSESKKLREEKVEVKRSLTITLRMKLDLQI